MRPERVAQSRALKERIAAEVAVLAPQLAYLRAIRDVLPDDGVVIDELTQVGYAARSGYETRKPRTYHLLGLSGHAWLGRRHRARRQARARRRAGGGAER